MREVALEFAARAPAHELGHRLGYPKGADKPEASTSQRNGTSGNTV